MKRHSRLVLRAWHSGVWVPADRRTCGQKEAADLGPLGLNLLNTRLANRGFRRRPSSPQVHARRMDVQLHLVHAKARRTRSCLLSASISSFSCSRLPSVWPSFASDALTCAAAYQRIITALRPGSMRDTSASCLAIASSLALWMAPVVKLQQTLYFTARCQLENVGGCSMDADDLVDSADVEGVRAVLDTLTNDVRRACGRLSSARSLMLSATSW